MVQNPKMLILQLYETKINYLLNDHRKHNTPLCALTTENQTKIVFLLFAYILLT